MPTITLRGSGPAPAGYTRCWRADCDSRRDPFTGRFGRLGNHYHPTMLSPKGGESHGNAVRTAR